MTIPQMAWALEQVSKMSIDPLDTSTQKGEWTMASCIMLTMLIDAIIA